MCMFKRYIAPGVVCLATAGQAVAQSVAGFPVEAGQPVYVEDFQAAEGATQESFGIFGRMRASREKKKSSQNAAAVSEAVVRELNNRGIAAHRLAAQELVPNYGLLIRGVFSETFAHGLFFSSLQSLGSSPPPENARVALTVSDLSSDPRAAIARRGTSGTLKGQGSAASFSPYAVAVKIVANKIESASSLDALAKNVVGELLESPSAAPGER